MIWLTWRQHRTQFVAGAVAVVLLGAFLLVTGVEMASRFVSSGLAQCVAAPGRNCDSLQELFSNTYSGLWFTIPLFLVVPGLVGVFWGAPLVARELEAGTHRLAWTQSVGRVRWAGTKIAAMAGATLVAAGLLAWALSWWSQPLLAASDQRFRPGIFDLRGIVPVAYALFALALGVVAGTLIKRTLPAMAATIGAYVAVRLAVDLWLRAHFAAAKTVNYAFFSRDPLSGTGDWIMSTTTLDGAGHVLGNGPVLDFGVLSQRCPSLAGGPPVIGKPGSPGQQAMEACIRRIGLHIQATYQPGSRYWMFQGIESAIFVVLAAGLVGLSLWWVRRRLA